MLIPKKVKHRKWQTDRKDLSKKVATRGGTELQFGSFGLRALSSERVKSNQIEAARKVVSRTLGKTGRYWIRIFPDRPITGKPAEVGMGKGKGDPMGWVAPVTPGRILFEVEGVSFDIAKEALRLAAQKLPVKTKFVVRRDFDKNA